jgi:PAS domain S-box-containing protein
MDKLSHLFPESQSEALQLYLTLFNLNPNGIFIYDEGGNLIDCNDTACEMHGIGKETLLNTPPKDFIHPEGYETFLEFQKTLKEGNDFYGESSGTTDDGKQFFVEVWGKRIHVNGVHYHFGTIKDITAQKMAIQTLSHQEKILEQKVKQRTKELEEALRKIEVAQRQIAAQEKLASLGSLIAGIAHEIKNPLNLILNASIMVTDLLKERFKELGETKYTNVEPSFRNDLNAAIEMTEMTINNAERADRIIQGMLNQARSEMPKMELVDVADLVRESLNLTYQASKSKYGLRVESHLDLQDVGKVLVFPHELRRALINIFENSFYSQKERAKTQQNYSPCIKVELKKERGFCKIKIFDNGQGIKKDLKDNIFQPFFTTKPLGEGTGLGMAIVKDIIIQLHQGKLEINSEEGDYTEVKICFPTDLKKR